MRMPPATLKSQPALSLSHIAALRLAASQGTGPTRRAVEAAMTWHYCGGHALMAEAVCGWGRQTVARGLGERRTGSMCLGAPAACRGRTRWEAQPPPVAQALRQRAAAQAQHAPTFRPGVPDTRLTAQAAWEALRAPGDGAEQWPSPSTMAAGRNRMGVRLGQVVKATPQKKSQEPDARWDTMQKKTRKPSQQDAANAGVSMVKRR